MKTIKKDELFSHLGDFLKSKGIELKAGSYSARIEEGCNLLADAINATQKTVSKTKVKVDSALDKVRQKIHESTAPPPPPPTKSKKGAPVDEKPPTSTRKKKATPKPVQS